MPGNSGIRLLVAETQEGIGMTGEGRSASVSTDRIHGNRPVPYVVDEPTTIASYGQ